MEDNILNRRVLTTLFTGLFVIFLMGCGPAEETVETVPNQEPVPVAKPHFVPVDIQAWANGNIDEGLPIGPQQFQGVDFQVGPKLLQVGSTSYRAFPHAILGIPVGKTCRAIHFLHATQGGGYPQPVHAKHENDGVEVGQYIFHYSDGTEAREPLIYGEHLRDGWDWDNNPPTAKSQIVWTGETAASRKYHRTFRLYWAVWENPHPEKPITALDFVSANAKAAPFCVAMTLETHEEPRTK